MKKQAKNKRADNGQLLPGNTANPNGRPLGQRNYATIYREALVQLAEAKNMTPEQVENLIEQTGLSKALEGDYKFFQDVRDRIHGKAPQSLEVTGKDGGPIDNTLTITFVRPDATP